MQKQKRFCKVFFFFKKMGQTILLIFVLFKRQIYCKNLTISDKALNDVFGTRTWGGRMVGSDESTVLWRHPIRFSKVGSKF